MAIRCKLLRGQVDHRLHKNCVSVAKIYIFPMLCLWYSFLRQKALPLTHALEIIYKLLRFYRLVKASNTRTQTHTQKFICVVFSRMETFERKEEYHIICFFKISRSKKKNIFIC